MTHGGASSRWTRRRAAAAGMAAVLALGGCTTGTSSGSGSGATGSSGGATDRASGPVACDQVDPQTWSPFQTARDLVAVATSGEAPHPLQPGSTVGPPTITDPYPTAEAFLAQSNVPDPDARLQVMEDAGYQDGVETEYAGVRPFKVQVLDFRDSGAVADYLTARLPNICARGGARAVTVFEDGDGISWIDPLGATHGEFILGSKQVSLILCECDDPDALATMAAWHDAWIEGYGSSASSSES